MEGVNTTRGAYIKGGICAIESNDCRDLVTVEPVQFYRLLIQNQNFMQFAKPLQAMYSRSYLKKIK